MSDLERDLYRTGVYGKANYAITRDGIQLDTPVVVIPEPPDRSLPQALRIIGLIYLAIGVYVLFRRWTRPARHPLLSLLPGLLRPLRAQVHRRIRPARLDRFLDRTSSPERSSPRSSSISHSASPKNASRASAAAGCCRLFMRPASGYSSCG